MKTKEELNALKKETEELKGKLAELTDDELKEITGGGDVLYYKMYYCRDCENAWIVFAGKTGGNCSKCGSNNNYFEIKYYY